MQPITTREARKHLALILKGPAPRLIGDDYHIRALVVPIWDGYTFNHPELAHALRKAQAAANRAFRELRQAAR